MKRRCFLSILLALMLVIANIFVIDISNTLSPNKNYEIVYAASKSSGAAGGYKSGSFSNSKSSTTKSNDYKSGNFSNSKSSTSNSKGSTSSSSSSKKNYQYSVPNTKTTNGTSNYSKQKIQKNSNSSQNTKNSNPGTSSSGYYESYGDDDNGKESIVQDLPVEGYEVPDKIVYETSAEHGINTQTDDTLNKNAGTSNDAKNTGGSFVIGLISIIVIIIAGIVLIRYFITKIKELINRSNKK